MTTDEFINQPSGIYDLSWKDWILIRGMWSPDYAMVGETIQEVDNKWKARVLIVDAKEQTCQVELTHNP